MKKENYFLCQVIKELSNDELLENESVIKDRMMFFLPKDTFVISDFKITNNKAIAICVCSSVEDYEYMLLRTSFEITKI